MTVSLRVLVLMLAAALLAPAPAVAQTPEQNADAEAFGSENMSHVANVVYDIPYPEQTDLPYGTDIEFASLRTGGGSGAQVRRLGGVDRVATAAAISAAVHDTADTVLVATARQYADALAGGPLAVHLDAPLLLSASEALSPATATEIERLGATQAVLLGGTGALSDQVEDDLVELGLTARRVGGDNRFETAAAIAGELPAATEVFLVEGEHAEPTRGWPDALSASGIAARQTLPILLTNAAFLPDATADALPADAAVTIVGGTASVSEEVADEVADAGATVERIAGANRYETSALAAEEAVARGADAAQTWLATGRSFPDGLVSGAAAGASGGVLLLVDGDDLEGSPATRDALAGLAGDLDVVSLAGGTAAISADTEDAVQALLPAGTGGELREYAIAGTEYNGMQIVDITDPTQPEVVAVYDCSTLQGDIQVFRQGERTFATYTSEDTSAILPESGCVTDAVAAGDIVFEDADGDGAPDDLSPAWGTYVAEITDPLNPVYAGFIPVIEGSHNGSVHPSGNFFYNSNSSLIVNPVLEPEQTTYIEYYDISDLSNVVRLGELDLPVIPGLGTESHDVTFSADGLRGYSAALSNTVIIDTSDPANPSVISNFEDPAVNVEHQASPIDVVASDGTQRRLLITQDELAGAAGNGFCPGGGLHVWDVTGDNELNPQTHKVGSFFIPDFRPAGGGVPGAGESATCTSHVFQMYPEQGIMTIAWYNAGVWVLDISGLADMATTPVSMPIQALGSFYFSNSDTWSFKTNLFEADGSFYGYGNDIARGLDVYRFDASAPTLADTGAPVGRWVGQAEAIRIAQQFRADAGLAPDTQLLPRCLLTANQT